MRLTRRDFTRLGALGLAAQFSPSLRAQATEKKIGYAVIGLGRIAGHFMPGAGLTSNSQITGLVSGHRDKADRIAADYGIPAPSIYNYENFDSIAENSPSTPSMSRCPIPCTPNTPFAPPKPASMCSAKSRCTTSRFEAMIAACKAANVKLMIAYRCHYEPTNLSAIQLIREGAWIGPAIESSFGFNISPGEWRINKKLAGGGPVFDVGIYSLNACRYLTGEKPQSISAYASVIDHDGRFNEVEENVSWTMKFPSGIVASCATTYGANMDGSSASMAQKAGLKSTRHSSTKVCVCAPTFRHATRRAQPRQRPFPFHGRGRAFLPLHSGEPAAAIAR